MSDFEKFKIKEYTYWSLFIHENQGYLGRMILWCKRENAEDLSEATLEELNELRNILTTVRKSIADTFQADWINYAFLGNEMRHLHCHIIPRYKTERVVAETVFKDQNWGHNYQTNHSFVTPPETLEQILQKLRSSLS